MHLGARAATFPRGGVHHGIFFFARSRHLFVRCRLLLLPLSEVERITTEHPHDRRRAVRRDAWANEDMQARARARARAASVAGGFFELSLIGHTRCKNYSF